MQTYDTPILMMYYMREAEIHPVNLRPSLPDDEGSQTLEAERNEKPERWTLSVSIRVL